MATSVRQRKYAAAWIIPVALLVAVIVGVWAMRASPVSNAGVFPTEAPKVDDVADEVPALMRPEPQPLQPPEAERSPTPATTESRSGFPFERGVRIALTVSTPEGKPASKAELVFAQLLADEPDTAPAWMFKSGKTDDEGRCEYVLANQHELFALRVFASSELNTSREAQLWPPFPRQFTLPLEPPGRLVVHVSDEGGVPVRELSVQVTSDLIETAWMDKRAAESEHAAHRYPFSPTATELELSSGPSWPLKRAVLRNAGLTNELGVAGNVRLQPGTWRVRLGNDPVSAAQLPEALIVSGETTQLSLRLGRATDTLGVEGLIVDEFGQPLPQRVLFVQAGDNPRSILVSDAFGAFRQWSAAGERATVEPRREHPQERFDPPFWEGPRGTRVVFQRRTNGEWVDATVRVVERSTHAPISAVALEYEVGLRSGTYGASRSFIGELHASLPVSEGLLMTVSAPGFGKFTFPSTALRAQASGSVLQIELDRLAPPKSDKDRALGQVGYADSIDIKVEQTRAGGH